MWGAIESGLDYRLTSFEEVESGKFRGRIKDNLFVGSVEFMREVFKWMGLNDVRLPRNSNRPHEIITLSQAKERADKGEKIFIKPVEIKLFTGFVLDQCKYPSINKLPDDTKVIAYQPFKNKINSEWRIYMHNGTLVDSRNYSGNFKWSPDYEGLILKLCAVVENKPKLIEGFPCAYTIDVGILETKENVIIEFNDFWAIGNYGIPNDLYLKLLTDRYFEIVK